MESVFYSKNPKYIHTIFDLKGSRGQTRMATAEDFSRAPTENFTSTVLKDNDFVDRKVQISLHSETMKAFREQITKDVEFLKKLKVIDYSLLVGIHYKDKAVPQDGQPFRLTPQGGAWKRERAPSFKGGAEVEEAPTSLQQEVSILDVSSFFVSHSGRGMNTTNCIPRALSL